MSRGIVSQKPFSRKKHKQTLKKKLNRSGISIPEIKISKKLKYILTRGIGFALLIIVGIIILLKSLFFKPEETISQIKFSDNTLATYQDIELFSLISNKVKGKNYYMLLSNKDKLLSEIQKKFPFILQIEFQLEPTQEEVTTENKTIISGIKFSNTKQGAGIELTGTNLESGGNTEYNDIQNGIQLIKSDFPLKLSSKQYENGGTLGIQLTYLEPRILVKLNNKKFAVRSENIFAELQTGMLLSTTKIDPKGDDTVDNLKEIFTVETPQYISGINNLSGFFFEVNLEKLIKIAGLAEEEFGNNMIRFVYLAGSSRFAIFTSDGKTLYFNFPEGTEIETQWETQLFKYKTLKEKYSNFEKIEKLDLGALEENKIIITNYY